MSRGHPYWNRHGTHRTYRSGAERRRRHLSVFPAFLTQRHRIYPLKLNRPPRGICRWCRLVIKRRDGSVNRRRTFCSKVCVTHYLLRADPRRMRRHVFYRDKGVCGDCGYQHHYLHGDWEADHILPLMIAFGDPGYWEPDNVVVLCKTPCHRNKSAADRRKYRKRDRREIARRIQDLESME